MNPFSQIPQGCDEGVFKRRFVEANIVDDEPLGAQHLVGNALRFLRIVRQHVQPVAKSLDVDDLFVRARDGGKDTLRQAQIRSMYLHSAGVQAGAQLGRSSRLPDLTLMHQRHAVAALGLIEIRGGQNNGEAVRGQIAIGATSLTKQFGAFTAVKNVSVQVRYGEIYGLLGANGAGKTTTIKMLCGLLPPTSGSMQLAGERGSLRSPAVRQQIGYMSQKFSLYDDLSIIENLEFFAGVYGVPEHERAEKMRWVISFSGLEGREVQLVGSLPQGWKQRVAFGAAILHEPSILFLDEPTSGVDPLARRSFWTMINRLADAGTAILVTTHYLEEAEQCNRLGFMVAGELVTEGSPSAIKAAQSGHLLEFIVDQPQRAMDLLKSDNERWRVSLFGERLHIITEDDAATGEQKYRQELEAKGVHVISVREGRFSLEDVFISTVEKARQEGKVAVEE
jgi:ABC-2 type transport system ATP-binding protein